MLRVVSDVHGKIDQYKKVIQDCDYSIQLGDMGFDYSGLADVDSSRHRFLGGNHDNYDTYYETSNSLGDFGQVFLGGVEAFYVRGAFSIDRRRRKLYESIHGKTWWEEEELSYRRLNEAIDLYEALKPRVVLTHECPDSIIRQISNPNILRSYGFDPDNFSTRTQKALESMLDIFSPDLWIFGHHHKNIVLPFKGTTFICLAELNHYDIKG